MASSTRFRAYCQGQLVSVTKRDKPNRDGEPVWLAQIIVGKPGEEMQLQEYELPGAHFHSFQEQLGKQITFAFAHRSGAKEGRPWGMSEVISPVLPAAVQPVKASS